MENGFLPVSITRYQVKIIQADHVMPFQSRKRLRPKRHQLTDTDAHSALAPLLGKMTDRLQQMAFAGVGVAADHHNRCSGRLRANCLQPERRISIAIAMEVIKPGVVTELHPENHL